MNTFLGIDTSCYTTSCALVDEEGHLLGEARKILEVPDGKRGLQQSQMVFQHTRALPELMAQLPVTNIAGIGVSAFPRRQDDSYMPAFLVGLGQAKTLGHLLDVPVYEFSHQENHMLAAMREGTTIDKEPFLALHLSGGTTELLYSQRREDGFFTTELIGGSNDVSAGQLIDRVGVAMGLPFPAGIHMDKLAKDLNKPLGEASTFPIANQKLSVSFGGPYSAIQRHMTQHSYETDEAKAEMAYDVLNLVGQSLVRIFKKALREYPVNHILAVGGVMSNSLLRPYIEDWCKRQGIQLALASPQYSPDNATGNAYGAMLLHQNR